MSKEMPPLFHLVLSVSMSGIYDSHKRNFKHLLWILLHLAVVKKLPPQQDLSSHVNKFLVLKVPGNVGGKGALVDIKDNLFVPTVFSQCFFIFF